MSSDRDRKAIELLEQTLDLADEERLAFLQARAGDDSTLISDVLELLEAHSQSDSLFVTPKAIDCATTAVSSKPSNLRFQNGQMLADRYEIEHLIGVGGMGEVYRGLDHRLGRRVAIKVLATTQTDQPDMLRRFEREAKAAATISHPNVVVLHDVLTHDDTTVAIAEYIHGRTLRSIINDGCPLNEAVDITRAIASGLAAAHQNELMHRDIKPENIMVNDAGQVKILDFGLARYTAPEQGQSITHGSSLLPGTVPYMSPEQIQSEELTVATDIFSLATLLYELLTGTHPFRGKTAFQTMQTIVTANPPSLSSTGVDAPENLQRLLTSMFAKSPSQRLHAEDVVQRLDQLRSAESHDAVQIVVPENISNVEQSGDTSERPTIAVLPLQVLSQQPEHQIFGEALAQEMIIEISRLRWIPVIARGSSFNFHDPGSDLTDVTSILGAKYILQGSLTIHGDRVSLSVQLCYAPEQKIIWAERFPGVLEDLLSFRFTVTSEIVGTLESRIQFAEAERATSLSTQNLDAWSAYHRGLAHMYRFNADDNAIAADYFRLAIKEDPTFARAFAGLSFTDFQNAFLIHGGDDSRVHRENARRNAERCAELDPLDPFSNLTLARVNWLEDDLDGARHWLDKAIELNPSYAFARYNRGLIHTMCGEAEPAESDVVRAIKLSPIDPLGYAMRTTFAMSQIILGRYEEALPPLEEAIRQPTAHVHIFAIAAAANELANNEPRATELARRVAELDPAYTRQRFFESFPFRDTEIRSQMDAAMKRLGW